jgi:predicted ATPase
MSRSPEYDFVRAELDGEILSRGFEVQTWWHVLTGAACCGKTTMVDMLGELGYRTVPETARVHIDCELAKGRTFEEMFGNAADEIAITEMQRDIELGLDPREVIFLDRGLPDSLTFYRFCGMDPNMILVDCLRRRYARVFILDRLPFQQDGARIDHDETSDRLDAWLERDYGDLGCKVVRVPVMAREERLAFLLANLKQPSINCQ